MGFLARMTTRIAQQKRLETLAPGGLSYPQTEVCIAPTCCARVRHNSSNYRFAGCECHVPPCVHVVSGSDCVMQLLYACETHVRWAAGVYVQEKIVGDAFVHAVKASRTLRCAAVLNEQRQLQNRGSSVAPSESWRALQLEPGGLPEAVVWLALLVGLGTGYQLGLGDERVVKDAASGAAMVLAADIAAKLIALCKLWQPRTPQASGDGSHSLSLGQSEVRPAEQQPHLYQSASRVRLTLAAAALDVALTSSRKADVIAIKNLAICTQLPSELGLPAAAQSAASSVKDPSDTSQQQTLEFYLQNALMSLTCMVRMLATPGQVAVPALAAACAHTKLPPVLQGIWQGTAGAALCAGDACDGSGYGIPLLLKLFADLCSAAAAAPIDSREKRRLLCEVFSGELRNILSAMGGGWGAARPPPPQWPPTKEEEAAAAAKAGTTAAAQAASDDMMRLLLEVRPLLTMTMQAVCLHCHVCTSQRCAVSVAHVLQMFPR